MRSLLVLKKEKDEMIFKIEDISERLVMQIMLDFHINEEKAADVLYTSAVFAQLTSPETDFSLKSWQEIYEMLKKELNR
jgi:hypothetical protein